MKQEIFETYLSLSKVLKQENIKKVLLVCSKFINNSFIMDYIKSLPIDFVVFNDYQSNPLYEDVLKGIEIYKTEKCDAIMSIGGGSAIDVAKCVKLFSNLDSKKNYLKQEFKGNNITHIAIPTTAGTGSESTRFAVIYYEDQKQSVNHKSIIPEYVILEPKMLESLPTYHKKSALMDALCQAIESYWSVNSTEESKAYAKESIKLILDNYKPYIHGDFNTYSLILKAANLSGKAINISQTTAAHAMSYKITSLYDVAHGHAVALTLPYLWEYMINNIDKCVDPRGKKYLDKMFNELSNLFNTDNSLDAIKEFKLLYDNLKLPKPLLNKESDLDTLVDSVNQTRLKNNPVKLTKKVIKDFYYKALTNQNL
ncbi:MAG TPA: phosphonoacetaldehyde reductase, partial [Gallicola sp.]|nr:phosphonoacetaldehyde reductase [Gallicola sp.]